ncbi:hypothetical protein OOU_Y34scaffold00726g52 [Pyricularia oryzae Y34]|uniref:Uncharacterized protein n=1 Tax=Pyricularia oryzae (strain Y34) TaxID=1143189 RepID=A0AA97PHT8_PYRO3|nr:hypothetical protein OOU_Y34scaffold00726g52 [Pyricularia oryzae Y34]
MAAGEAEKGSARLTDPQETCLIWKSRKKGPTTRGTGTRSAADVHCDRRCLYWSGQDQPLSWALRLPDSENYLGSLAANGCKAHAEAASAAAAVAASKHPSLKVSILHQPIHSSTPTHQPSTQTSTHPRCVSPSSPPSPPSRASWPLRRCTAAPGPTRSSLPRPRLGSPSAPQPSTQQQQQPRWRAQPPAAPRVQQAKEMVTALKADVEGDLADWKSGDVAKMKSKIGTVTSKVDSVSSMVSSILGDVELGGLSEADKKFALGMFADAQELASEVENSMGSIDSNNRAALKPELDILRLDLGGLLGPLLNLLMGLLNGLLGAPKEDPAGKPGGESDGLLGSLLGGLLGGLGL